MLEQAFSQTAQQICSAFARDLRRWLAESVGDPQFRLAATEELHRLFLAMTDQLLDRYQRTVVERDAQATAGYDCLMQYAYFQKGMRKPTAAELAEALRNYPRARLEALVARSVIRVYQAIREQLTSQLSDASVAREKVAAAVRQLSYEIVNPPASLGRLMPSGCDTIATAVTRLLQGLTDHDFVELDCRIQSRMESETGGLLDACLALPAGMEAVIRVVLEESRRYVDARLGAVNMAAMFAERYHTVQQSQEAIRQAYFDAEPSWVGRGPWAADELTILGCPGNPNDESLREAAIQAIPASGMTVATTPNELTIYREWPAVPLAALPHLGPAAASAYATVPQVSQCSLHSRLDVMHWLGVDAETSANM